jgi:hypothetical protein
MIATTIEQDVYTCVQVWIYRPGCVDPRTPLEICGIDRAKLPGLLRIIEEFNNELSLESYVQIFSWAALSCRDRQETLADVRQLTFYQDEGYHLDATEIAT